MLLFLEVHMQQVHPVDQPKPQPARKPYTKPTIEIVQLRVKEHVMAVCKTGSSATTGDGCRVPVTQCFS